MSSDLLIDHHGVLALQSAGTPCPLAPEAADAACATLELPEALRVVATHAVGPLGRTRLLERRPTGDVAWVREELARVGEILALLRRGERLDICPVPDLRPALARLRVEGSVLEGQDLVDVRTLLAAARQAGGELRRLAEHAPRSSGLAAAPVDRAVERRLDETVDDEGVLLDSASPELRTARRGVHSARERLIRKLEAILRALDPQAVPPDAAVTLRGGRYVIPVRRDSRARPAGIVHDESGSAGTLFIEPTAAIELGNTLRAAHADEAREVGKVLRDVTDLLRPHRGALGVALEMCIAMDDLVARARYALAVDGDVPEVRAPGEALTLCQARHPLLVATGRPVVPFDISLDSTERTVLISGPNTGGKTVLLKGVGLLALLVQCGIVPPVGTGSALPVFERFYADIGDHQSIAASLSTFSAHVAALREILDHGDARSLVLLDEVGSGTDPAEGAALAAAALRSLHARRVLTLATTHLGVLKTLATDEPGIVNASLQFDTASLTPTYRFQKGVPGRSYGLAIARRLGVDEAVLARAEADVPEGERTLDGLVEAVEERERHLRAGQEALTDRLAETERLSARLTRDASLLEERETTLRRAERDAESRARQEARAYLLAARARVEAALEMAAAAVDDAAAREARRLVEEGIQGASEASEASTVQAPPAGMLLPGTRVRLTNGATGLFATLRSDGKALVHVNGLRMVVPATALRVLPPTVGGGKPAPVVRDMSARPDAPFEIDLRGMRADEAETATVAALDAAILAEHPHLRIIHGMGTGVLRNAVRDLVAGDRRVAGFDFAPRHQGGTGVTIVELKG